MDPRTRKLSSRLVAALFVTVLLAACGGGAEGAGRSTTPSGAPPPAFDAVEFLRTFAAAHSVLPPRPDGTLPDLEARKRAARRPDDKRAAMPDLALANLHEAERANTPDEATHHLEAAAREARAAVRGSRDEALVEICDFVLVWHALRVRPPNAARVVDAYLEHHPAAGPRLRMAWMIRGEVAMATSDWPKAKESFRFVMGDLASPLYGYALYRTAEAQRGAGEADASRESLVFVVDQGCARDAPSENIAMARQAWAELGRPAPEGTPDAERPFCAVRTQTTPSGTGLDLR